MEEIRQRFFPASRIGADAAAEAHYDMRTIHDAAFGGSGGYVMDSQAVLDAIGRFIAAEPVS